jgi:hypothetical protein
MAPEQVAQTEAISAFGHGQGPRTHPPWLDCHQVSYRPVTKLLQAGRYDGCAGGGREIAEGHIYDAMSPMCQADCEIAEILVRCDKDAAIFIGLGQHRVVHLGGTDVGSCHDVETVSP